jgi:hypothetical protein
VGFNRVTWTPGHDRKPVGASRFRGLARLRREREARARETTVARALEGSLVSLAALLGSEVRDPDGRSVGRLSDVVVRWTTRGAYPAVRAIVVKIGKGEVVIGARWLEVASPSAVRLRSSRAYASAVERHPGDVALAHDILDRQVVDADGVQIVRPADLWLYVTVSPTTRPATAAASACSPPKPPARAKPHDRVQHCWKAGWAGSACRPSPSGTAALR